MSARDSSVRYGATLLFLVLSTGGEAWGQLNTRTARSESMAGAYTALARGYEAAFWNPANLGLPDRPRWSVGLAGATARLTNNALTYGQITDLYGRHLDDATKSKLLADVRSANRDELWELDFGLDGSALGFSIGRFGFGLATRAAGRGDLSADALELVLFGNDGEAGTGKDFDLSGSNAHAWWLSGGHVSYAQPFAVGRSGDSPIDLSVGASLAYGVVHDYLRFDDRGTLLRSQPLDIDAEGELIESRRGDAGRAWGLDLGVSAGWDGWVAGLVLENLFADVVWDLENFDRTQYRVDADFERTVTVDSTARYDELEPADQERLQDLLDRLEPVKRVRLGAAYPLAPEISLAADYYEVVGGRLKNSWDRSLALGGEFSWLRVVPLRAGIATDFTEVALTAGAGLYLGVFHADVAVGRWGLARGEGVLVALSVSFWPPARH